MLVCCLAIRKRKIVMSHIFIRTNRTFSETRKLEVSLWGRGCITRLVLTIIGFTTLMRTWHVRKRFGVGSQISGMKPKIESSIT